MRHQPQPSCRRLLLLSSVVLLLACNDVEVQREETREEETVFVFEEDSQA